MSLKSEIERALPLAFGISGPLATPLVRPGTVDRLIAAAIERGVTLFDTAPAYGDGKAERRLGRALTDQKDILISTKAGLSSAGLRQRMRDFSPDGIERSIDESMGRLGRPIDLLWLHGAAPEELTDTLLTRLDGRCRDGSVRYLGLAGRGAELEQGFERGPFSAVMLPVHAGLAGNAPVRVKAFRGAGAITFAIEVMTPSRGQRRGLSTGALWRIGRRAIRPTPPSSKPPALAPAEALQWALRDGGADIAVITTTRRDRLHSNIAMVQAMADSH